jgi:Cytidylate kinase-like family
MRTICVSRGSYRRGKELAERLAECLGCACLSREEIVERATLQGIAVGKLEEAVVKRRPLGEPLALLVEHFKAFVTASLCERVLRGDLVYHGRTGHLVLPGVPHVMRVRAITDPEDHIEGAVQRLHLKRERARRYVEQVDDDIRRWVRTLYNLDLDDPNLFNVTVNCSKMTVRNIASGLVGMVSLPEFEATPASLHRVENLLLAARCRLVLAQDERTRALTVQVHAEAGRVSVTYLPHQARAAEAIPAVLERVEGVRELHRTVAVTSILWVQERFDPQTETFGNVLDLAQRWNAAVDVVRLLPGAEATVPAEFLGQTDVPEPSLAGTDGGILEDTGEEVASADDGGVKETLHRLIQAGRAGAACTVAGDQSSLISSVCDVSKASLVVVDNLFLAKPAAARKRLTRDMAGALAERMRIPVIGAEELKAQLAFGVRQWASLVVLLAFSALAYVLVFTNQDTVLGWLRAGTASGRVLAVAGVLAFAPLLAFLWGTAAHYLLRLVRFE